MKLVLPPKRWQSAEDACYDSIRHRPWFNAMLRRKLNIPALRHAHLLVKNGSTQIEACAIAGVSSRELRDFAKQSEWSKCRMADLREQKVINSAYAIYCDSSANHPFYLCVKECAIYWSLPSRPMVELWEVNPCIYPDGYLEWFSKLYIKQG